MTRNKLRSFLTVLSIGFSLALMTVLHGYMAMQGVWGREAAKYNRLVVMNVQGFSGQLPISYIDRIRATEGVVAAVPYVWFGGNYKEEQMPFAQMAIDASQALEVFNNYKMAPNELEAWRKDRMGCVVDRHLAEERGWVIGERIPLKGTYYPVHLELTMRGTFEAEENTGTLWFHYEYLDEQLRANSRPGAGSASIIFARVDSGDKLARVAAEIDERFASSPNPTRTQTEAAFAQMFTDMLGNIQVYIRNIGLAIVFSLSLVCANAMAMSMRERTTEVAVLKALGFSKPRVVALVLGEACVIAVLGGILGIGMGCGVLQSLHGISSQWFPFDIQDLAGLWLVWLLVTALGIGLISGVVPAGRAATLSVVDGLRRVV